MYIVAGHKGQAQAVKNKERQGRRRRLKGSRGRGTLEKEKPPVLGMLQRNGEVVIKMLANVKQKTIAPFIKSFISRGGLIYTDEYCIYDRLEQWGYEHQAVNHSAGEYARKMAMAFMRCMSTALRASGRYCALGFAPIAASRKKSCHSIWASSSSSTTLGAGVGHYYRPSLRFW